MVLEIQNQGVSRAVFPLKVLVRILLCLFWLLMFAACDSITTVLPQSPHGSLPSASLTVSKFSSTSKNTCRVGLRARPIPILPHFNLTSAIVLFLNMITFEVLGGRASNTFGGHNSTHNSVQDTFLMVTDCVTSISRIFLPATRGRPQWAVPLRHFFHASLVVSEMS